MYIRTNGSLSSTYSDPYTSRVRIFVKVSWSRLGSWVRWFCSLFIEIYTLLEVRGCGLGLGLIWWNVYAQEAWMSLVP